MTVDGDDKLKIEKRQPWPRTRNCEAYESLNHSDKKMNASITSSYGCLRTNVSPVSFLANRYFNETNLQGLLFIHDLYKQAALVDQLLQFGAAPSRFP